MKLSVLLCADRQGTMYLVEAFAVVLVSFGVFCEKREAENSGFNCTAPANVDKMESYELRAQFQFCAEEFLFEKAQKAKREMSPDPKPSQSYIAAAWEYFGMAGSKNSKRAKCAASRTAIFAMGAPGSRRDELEPKWKPLLAKDCGFVRINADRLLTGEDGFEFGKQVWQATYNRMKGKDSSDNVRGCIKEELRFQLRIDKIIEALIETAISELHSFVYETHRYLPLSGPGVPGGFSDNYKTFAFAVFTPISAAVMNVWASTIHRNSTEPSAHKTKSAPTSIEPIGCETLCALHQSHTALATHLATMSIGYPASSDRPIFYRNYSIFEAPHYPWANLTADGDLQNGSDKTGQPEKAPAGSDPKQKDNAVRKTREVSKSTDMSTDLAGPPSIKLPELQLVYQTDSNGQEIRVGSASLLDKVGPIAQTSAAMLEEHVQRIYGEYGKQALKDFKQLSLDCGFCGCEAGSISAKAKQSSNLYASAIQKAYRTDNCNNPSLCYGDANACEQTTTNEETTIKCANECGACYSTESVGRGECPKASPAIKAKQQTPAKKNKPKDSKNNPTASIPKETKGSTATSPTWRSWFSSGTSAAMSIMSGSGLGSLFSSADPGKSKTTSSPAKEAPQVWTNGMPANAQGCETDWQKLLKLDINTENSVTTSAYFKYTPALVIEVDQAGYVLVKPEHAVELSKNRNTSINEYSFWAFMKCQKGSLVLDHCRFGNSSDTSSLKIPVNNFFETTNEAKKDKMVYACREGATADSMTPFIHPSDFWLDRRRRTERECKRFEGSRWCGIAADIERNGCLDDWLTLLKTKNVEPDKNGYSSGKVLFKSKDKKDVELRLTCEQAKLKPQTCYAGWSKTLIPAGSYLAYRGFFYVCPKATTGYSLAELEKAILTLKAEDGPLPKELSGFKPAMPEGIDEACAEDFRLLTKNGNRKVPDSRGYVEIVEEDFITSGQPDQDARYHPYAMGSGTKLAPVWALFTCTKASGKLKLDHCMYWSTRRIDPGSYAFDDGYYYNCGTVAATTTANVDKMVTRTKENAAVGLIRGLKSALWGSSGKYKPSGDPYLQRH